MEILKEDFLNKATLIIENEEKLKKIEVILSELLIKCTKAFELREAVVILDEDLKIIEVDDVFKDFLKRDFLSHSFYSLFSDKFIDISMKFIENVKNKKFFSQKNVPLINGEIADIKGESFNINKKNYYFISFRKKEINSVMYELNVIDEEIANLVLRVRDFESLMQEILKVFISSKLFDFGWVAKIDNELKRIIPITTLNDEEEDIEFKSQIFDFDYFKGILDVLIHNKEFIVTDIKFREKEYKKNIIFPIYRKWEYSKENEIAYVVLLYSKENLSFHQEEIVLLKEIIYKINIAITDLFMKEKAKIIFFTDVLTSIPKRELFIKDIQENIKEKVPFAIVIIDIDKLKKVNDVLGFWAGDKAIKNLSSFLIDNLKNCFIARIGSDEFGVIIKGDKYKIFEKLNKILQFNEKIVQINGNEVYLPISVGVAFYPDDGVKEEDLILKAEKALGIAKKRGGKGISYAKSSFTLLPKDYLELEKELQKAVKNDEYTIYYQPIIDIKENKIWGVEALLRWKSKKRGLVSPAKFIPILEDSGLINEVGDVIIKKVLVDSKEFNELFFTFSINVSVIQLLSQNLALKLIKEIEAINANKEKIIVEITESVLMENIDIVMPQLRLLEKEGIKIEIDDFGTGYSSLSYLKRLPISALKIDRSFVKDILVEKEDKHIVQAIISMAKAMNIRTIAEGVESKEAVNELKKMGVDYIQGFYFAKPMPKEELREFLSSF
ncbi:hypothetical protein JCM11957_07670 [Caminibacter profundus]